MTRLEENSNGCYLMNCCWFFWFTVTAIIDFYKSPSKLHIALKKLMKTQLQKQAH